MAPNTSVASAFSLFLLCFLTIITFVPLAASLPVENEVVSLPVARRGFNTARLPAQGSMRGVWVWDTRYIWNPTERIRMLGFLKANGFNRILMQMPFVWNGGIQLVNQTAIGDLLDTARLYGIAIEALDGAPDMTEPENQATTAAKVRLIMDYNAGRPRGAAHLTGIHWDIEIYSLPSWSDQTKRNALMLNLVNILSKTQATIAAAKSSMTLAFDLPFWYHSVNTPGDTCTFTWNGKTQSLDRHIIDVVDYTPVMSYRRTATGDNSIVSLSMDAINYAKTVGKRVCPGMETVRLDSTPAITFFGTTAAYYTQQRNAVVTTLQGNAGFQGVMTHCYPEVRKLITGS